MFTGAVLVLVHVTLAALGAGCAFLVFRVIGGPR